ncbi:uncharacterized protein LOC109545606 [Dendroctonus ponderosae]|uniref:uncharacterized protein LOC109545606 n=1 Tax=Dendroctonus ponderosae TaxID=77166 RepID=UPI002035663D|nr:uncharacterized protein LOC109545606 [Dendroctonus ponderosae]
MTASSRFITYIFFAGLMQAKIILVHGDCWYDSKKHEENSEVLTGEPCLNCTCSRGALLCYLRVCPKLPNPPPPGCILLHRFKTCCPELICSDFHDGGNSVEARAEPHANLDVPSDENNLYENACISNGSIYGSGSAMHSSSMCEYCYCLSGKQVCVKPKCLLFIEGCQPIYETSSCCPVRYNCTRTLTTLQVATQKPSTTTAGYEKKTPVGSGCLVESAYHPEGSKVVGIGHSVCDNCYCLRGLLRCEPLSCAPPLLGCTPVVKSGECCAASYNCNGTLEVEPEPNYGLFPIISKEYSKLRKEVNRQSADGVVTGAPFYVQVEDISKATPKLGVQRSPETFGTTRQFFSANFQPSSTQKPLGDTAEDDKFFLISSSRHRSSTERNIVSSEPPKSDDADYFGSLNIFDLVGSLLDGKSYRKVDTISAEDLKNSLTEDGMSASTEPLATRATTGFPDFSTNEPDSTETGLAMSTTEESDDLVTVTAILNSTDCNNGIESHFKNDQPVDPIEINHLAEGRTDLVATSTDFQTEDYAYFSSPENLPTEEVDYESPNGRNRVKIGGSKLPPDIEAILNITNQKIEDFDYDYKEPTLPPSLPNLKIIPFLATDALDVIKDSPKDPTDQLEDKADNMELEQSSNLFKPPVKTEGGFVPKAPSTDSFYNSIFAKKPPVKHVEPDASVKVTNCLSRGQEIAHGMEVPSDLPCVTCSCFFGNIACQKVTCPPPEPGCSREPAALCCPNYACNQQKVPLLEPAKLPQEIVPVAGGMVQLAPFKDVIRTEPAPNLQSLIGDRASLQTTSSSTPATLAELSSDRPTTAAADKQPESSFDELLKFIFSGTPDVIEKPISHNPSLDKNKPTVVQIKSVSPTDEKPELQLIKPINDNTLDGSGADVNKTEAVCTKCDEAEDSPAGTAAEHQPMGSSSKKIAKGDQKGSLVGVGLLKLAGCNIYGRMYRVGRIISELSGPCLECKCTEVGVQCIELRCTKNNGKIKN